MQKIHRFLSNLADFIPGFRTRKIWKGIIASIYYFIAVMFVPLGGFWLTLFLICIPYFVFGLARMIEAKREHGKVYRLPIFIIVGIMVFSLYIMSRLGSSSLEADSSQPSPTPSASQTKDELSDNPIQQLNTWVSYNDFDVMITDARVCNKGIDNDDETFLYLTVNVKNNNNRKKLSYSFLNSIAISTVDDKQIEGLNKSDLPHYNEELVYCKIDPGKYISGEIAFKIPKQISNYLFYMQYYSKKERIYISIPYNRIDIDPTNYLLPASMGETITYGDFDVMLKGARISDKKAPKGKTVLYLIFDLKNNTDKKIMSSSFLSSASLSTKDGLQLENHSHAQDYIERLDARTIKVGKYISGEVAFIVNTEVTDYLFSVDLSSIKNKREILIEKAQVKSD